MEMGNITGYLDLTQMLLYLFWGFFFGLVLYLQREGKREGYPLVKERWAGRGYRTDEGIAMMPAPKVFRMPHGLGNRVRPGPEPDQYDLAATPTFPGMGIGSPLAPTGNPMVDGVGPAAWAERPDHPELLAEGTPKIQPLRITPEYNISDRDPDPRGKPVYGLDGEAGGTVVDAWVDRGEAMLRYLEVEVASDSGTKNVLLPIFFAQVRKRDGHVTVKAIKAEHFQHVPTLSNPDQVTLGEEDRIVAYYGGGNLYATKDRAEPWL